MDISDSTPPTAASENAAIASNLPTSADPPPQQASTTSNSPPEAMDIDNTQPNPPTNTNTNAPESGGEAGKDPSGTTSSGHSQRRMADRVQGYERRGGHANTKQGKKEGKKAKKDLGRGAFNRERESRQADRVDEQPAKRVKLDENGAEVEVTEEAGEKEARLPKRKVAVLIGYCGHGYKGMQLNYPNKTIEGDIFAAFVAAGAISAANADDPKKSSLVRCARTDKGVHAAGNVISLKLIIEDPDIVQKINSHLPDQIRVWSIQRTLGSFSCYQMCDSRVYEYLIPTHVFLPPHPSSFLAKTLRKHAIEAGDLEGWESRQEEVAGFWDNVQKEVEATLTAEGYSNADIDAAIEDIFSEDNLTPPGDATDDHPPTSSNSTTEPTSAPPPPPTTITPTSKKRIPDDLKKKIKSLHIHHKKLWRIPPARLARVRSALSLYEGTRNFHNYTIQKSFRDASAKRHIKSFIAQDPILINGTEYLSLRVHGQSFMMHQIRKMVGMALLVVRTGCPLGRITQSYGNVSIAIPKAPGVGLLLENPLFETYNKKCQMHGREPIDFEKHKDEIDKFREKYIYGRMFEEEAKGNLFQSFVAFIDGYKNPTFTYLGSKGFEVLEEARKSGKVLQKEVVVGEEEEDEGGTVGEEEG